MDGGNLEAANGCSLYNEPLNSSVFCKCVDGDDTNDTIACDDEDDSNVDEVYSDFRKDTTDFSKLVGSHENVHEETP